MDCRCGLPTRTADDLLHVSSAGALNLYHQAVDSLRRPVDDECDSPVADVHHAGRGTRLFGFEVGPCEHAFFFPGSAAESASFSRPSPAGSLARLRGKLRQSSPTVAFSAYQSAESGHLEVRVRPFPQVDRDHWQVSTPGGTRPAWSRSGRDLSISMRR